jgi:hypothetical protein
VKANGHGTGSSVGEAWRGESPLPAEFLRERRSDIGAAWISAIIGEYADHTSRFLRTEKDPFRNPVGEAFRRGLPLIVAELLGAMNRERIAAALEPIVKIRAVQDYEPSRALGFMFVLKRLIRDLKPEGAPAASLDLIDERIDRVALLAFDIYQACREKICEIRVSEMKRRVSVIERMHPSLGDSGTAGGSGQTRDRAEPGGIDE